MSKRISSPSSKGFCSSAGSSVRRPRSRRMLAALPPITTAWRFSSNDEPRSVVVGRLSPVSRALYRSRRKALTAAMRPALGAREGFKSLVLGDPSDPDAVCLSLAVLTSNRPHYREGALARGGDTWLRRRNLSKPGHRRSLRLRPRRVPPPARCRANRRPADQRLQRVEVDATQYARNLVTRDAVLAQLYAAKPVLSCCTVVARRWHSAC